MATSLEPLKGGYDVDENAIRFSNYFHVLRELVHLSCGWLPLEPRLEVKYALGDHLHDDARAVTKIKRRLYELRTPSDYPGAPAEELAALLDRANGATTSAEYVAIAYGELKPTLVAAIRIHLDTLDPIVDEPSLRLLTQILHRQERHMVELPAIGAARVRGPRRAADPPARGARAEGHAAARRARPRRLRRGHRGGRHLPHRRPLHQRRREPRPDGPRGAEALLPRADGRGAVRGRADGAQLARAPRDALGLPRRHGPPDAGTRSATPRSTTA